MSRGPPFSPYFNSKQLLTFVLFSTNMFVLLQELGCDSTYMFRSLVNSVAENKLSATTSEMCAYIVLSKDFMFSCAKAHWLCSNMSEGV